VDVGFKEGQSVQKQLKRNPRARSSPLQPRTRIVRDGDTLWSIAAAVYGDPAKWRALARANALVNPRILAPGTDLLVPYEE
jgi:nucleoid-associated protein YgaU